MQIMDKSIVEFDIVATDSWTVIEVATMSNSTMDLTMLVASRVRKKLEKNLNS